MIPFLKNQLYDRRGATRQQKNFLKSLMIQLYFRLKLKINGFLEIISKSTNKLTKKYLKYLNFKKRSLTVL